MDSHFFDDLGANSLLLAKFSALVRKQTELPPLSMREIYRNPDRPAAGRARSATPPRPRARRRRRPGSAVRASSAGYLRCSAPRSC